MSDKERFHEAINVLRITAGALPAEGRRLTLEALEIVLRFTGSLRREKSSLKRENESNRNDFSTLKGRDEMRASDLARLERLANEQHSEIERLLGRLNEPGIRLPGGSIEGADFSIIKAKCLACSLHFILCTDSPERHSGATLHCPECGQHDGGFLVWSDVVRGFIYELVPGRSEWVGAPKPRVLGMSPSEEPESLGRSMTVIPAEIGVEPEVMIDALRNLYARAHEQHGGSPPEGTLIHEDFSRDGEVLFFAFAAHTGEGRSFDGCALPDPGKSREEQVMDLILASPYLKRVALESKNES